jgi:hypothetical protein
LRFSAQSREDAIMARAGDLIVALAQTFGTWRACGPVRSARKLLTHVNECPAVNRYPET